MKVDDVVILPQNEMNAFITITDRGYAIHYFVQLFKYLEPREITAIFLHEYGHRVYFMYFILGQLLGSIGERILLGIIINSLPFAIPTVLFITLLIISFFISPTTMTIGKIAEYVSDMLAVKLGYGKELSTALYKLYKISYSKMIPISSYKEDVKKCQPPTIKMAGLTLGRHPHIR